MHYLVQIFFAEKATDLLGVHLLASHSLSDTTEKLLCGSSAPVTAKAFTVLKVQLQLIRSVLKELILFQGYLFSVNIFQRMQADGIACKAIVLVFQETQQHLESFQNLPTNGIKPEPVCLKEKKIKFFKK